MRGSEIYPGPDRDPANDRWEMAPGSPRSVAAGCKCPVIDNGRGRGREQQGGEVVYVINFDCPIHVEPLR